jgi:hypothetical protein
MTQKIEGKEIKIFVNVPLWGRTVPTRCWPRTSLASTNRLRGTQSLGCLQTLCFLGTLMLNGERDAHTGG